MVIKSLPIFFLIATGLWAGCQEEEKRLCDCPQQAEKLLGTWRMKDVTLDNVSKKIEYKDFTMEISWSDEQGEFIFTVGGNPTLSPWPGSGRMKFGSNMDQQIIVVDPQSDVSYSVTPEQLELSMACMCPKDYEPGEIHVPLMSTWVFTFTR